RGGKARQGGEQVGKRRLLQDQVPLDEIHRVLPDELEIGLELLAFRDHVGAQAMAELGQGSEDAARLRPAAGLADDLEVDLDLGDRQVRELQEAAVAFADVVQGEAKAGEAQLGE